MNLRKWNECIFYNEVSLMIIFVFLSILTWWRILHYADHIGFFIDESLHFTFAAAKFFRILDYSGWSYSNPFDPRMTSGIAASWLAGLSWNAGYSLFVQRVLLSVYGWLFFLAVTYVLLKQLSISKMQRLAFAAFLWLLLLRHSPNTLGFVQNLGELQAGLWSLLGFASLKKRPNLAFVCFGVSVWLAKLVFLPAVFAIGFSYWLSTAQWNRRELWRAIRFITAFLLPLFLWMLLIFFRWGGGALANWVYEFFTYAIHEGPSGLDGKSQVGLQYRLEHLEWSFYAFSLKVKILALMFGPALAAGLIFARCQREEKFYVVILPIISLVYAYWWFFLNPEMFLRHAQPAFFLGAGFLFFSFCKIIKIVHKKSALVVPILVAFFLIFTSIWEISVLRRDSWPIFMEGLSYARACRGSLTTPVCAPGFYTP